MIQEKLFFRVTEAAEVWALSRSKVYELIHTGDVRVVHIGKAVRITREELQRFADAVAGKEQA